MLFALFAWYWLRSFIELMLLSDDDFPGRYDKILWVAAFLFMFLLTPLAFSWWKGAYMQLRRSEGRPPSDTSAD